MQYVAEGDNSSGLTVHVAAPDGTAACGTYPHSRLRGRGWWYDRREDRYRRMVPQALPAGTPVTCGRCKP